MKKLKEELGKRKQLEVVVWVGWFVELRRVDSEGQGFFLGPPRRDDIIGRLRGVSTRVLKLQVDINNLR
jgi:hypothetical protein